ncbi:hypothetical protein SPSIL_008860 [Sporomusa silvacetica DSM 10669]|uniref:Uncharacterized protein n=1 Tax=Sporomusa silvacetica DSM 10669 TaxID=1123289 RepID=A0ABZ3IGH5_9FIRM|nr:hypothetical protein [Sporomusa silvacetica]OZC13154.1 hypothetical protein SPSIL_56100 [Sporomusa silvacetica DSM 10669]
MAAKEAKEVNIQKIIEQAVDKAVKATMFLGADQARTETKNLFKQTEIRLYAYSELRNNIAKYNLDIKDLRCESPGRSKDIASFSTHGGGIKFTEEEIQEARIMILQKKIYRDQTEIDEIEFALEAVQNDEYYPIIEMRYFKGMKDDKIAEIVSCDPSTIRRNKNRMIRRIAVKLYGAQAVC